MHSSDYLKKVREQYENYPYPERDPLDESHRLIATESDCLDRLNHYCFEGSKDYGNNFRALIAGGGTGDAAIFLAEQLMDFGAEIVYLDISSSSMQVAKQRAKARGLNNIQWLKASILDIPYINIGTFDYINCSGVLHHLDDPAAGLSALNTALKQDGAMAIMIYARYGREGVYQIQELMRRINSNEPDMDKCVRNCRSILDNLAETHILNHIVRLYPDWKYKEPIEMYDLFLHSQDRAYTIPELYEYIEHEDLRILHFLPGNSQYGNGMYGPESYTKDDVILEYIDPMPLREKQAIAELMNGLISRHTFYAAKHFLKPANARNTEMIPYLNMHAQQGDYESLYRLILKSETTVRVRKSKSHMRINFTKTVLTEHIFKYLDGNRTLGEIYALLDADTNAPKTSLENFQVEFKRIFQAMNKYDFVYLRSKGIKRPLTMRQISYRQNNIHASPH